MKCVGSQSMMDQLNATVMADIVSHYLPTHIYVLVSRNSTSHVTMLKSNMFLSLQPQMKDKRPMLSSADK